MINTWCPNKFRMENDGKCRKSKVAKFSIFLTKNASNWRVQCKQTFTTFFGFRLWYTVQNLIGHPVVVDVKNIRTIPRYIWMYWYLRQNVRKKKSKKYFELLEFFWGSIQLCFKRVMMFTVQLKRDGEMMLGTWLDIKTCDFWVKNALFLTPFQSKKNASAAASAGSTSSTTTANATEFTVSR